MQGYLGYRLNNNVALEEKNLMKQEIAFYIILSTKSLQA